SRREYARSMPTPSATPTTAPIAAAVTVLPTPRAPIASPRSPRTRPELLEDAVEPGALDREFGGRRDARGVSPAQGKAIEASLVASDVDAPENAWRDPRREIHVQVQPGIDSIADVDGQPDRRRKGVAQPALRRLRQRQPREELHVVRGALERPRAVAGVEAIGAALVSQRQQELGSSGFRRELALSVDDLRARETRLVDQPHDQLERAPRILGHALGIVDDQAEQLLVEVAVLQLVRGDQTVELVARRSVRDQRAQPLHLGLQFADFLAEADELLVDRIGGDRLGIALDDRSDGVAYVRRRRTRGVDVR